VYIKRSEDPSVIRADVNPDAPAPQESYFALDISCPTAKWDVVDLSPDSENASPRQVVMGAVNTVTTMYPVSSDSIYGTAFNTMGLGGGGSVKVDCVTVFPAGAKWATLAYLSLGLQPERLALVIRDKVALSKTEKSLVSLIAAQCHSSSDESIGYSPVLRRAVDALFAPWISAPAADSALNASAKAAGSLKGSSTKP
jgi:hypothetical protein